MKYSTAVGYPLGITRAQDGTLAFCLETQQGMVLLTPEEFQSWTEANLQESSLSEHMDSLRRKKVLLCTDSRSEWENGLKACQAVRQGYSAVDENGDFVIWLAEKKHKLSALQFKLWLCADGVQPLSSGLFQLFLEPNEAWPEAIRALAAKELIFLR